MSDFRPTRRFERRRRGRFEGSGRVDLVGRQPLSAPATYVPPATPPGSQGTVKKRHSRPLLRLSIGAVVVMALFATLVVRLYSLQVLNGKKLNVIAQQITTRQVTTPAPRGGIYARGGQALAYDTFEWVVTLNATPGPTGRIADPAVERRLVALLPGLTLAQIRADLASNQYSPYQPIPVAFNVSPQSVLYIEAHKAEFPGVDALEEPVRSYPYGSLATQTIGYVRQITAEELKQYARYNYPENAIVGQSGLEQQYELALQGKPGVITEEVDPSGNVVRTVSETSAGQGDSLVLNLDLPLEQEVSSALGTEIVKLQDSGLAAPLGAAVVLDPQNGHVYAMSSYPSYDDNWWVTGMTNARYSSLTNEAGYPLNNWAIQGFQPPGSTFKLATATAALDDGLISPSTEIDDTGVFPLPGSAPLHDADNVPLGWVNVQTALTASSDFFFYTLGEWFWNNRARYGETPVQDIAHRYGLGASLGIDLPENEVQTGWVDSPAVRRALHAQAPNVYANSWYLGDNVEMAFGQGETVVTPIELATAYATFANGGTRYAPELAAAVVSPSGKLVRRIKPKVEAHVPLPTSTRDVMLAGFEGAVASPNGTAYGDFVGFPFDKWNLAGKTGTATVTVNDQKQPTSWFVAFGGPRGEPAQYVVCVEINQAGYGASAAAPVARQILDYLYHHGIGKLSLRR